MMDLFLTNIYLFNLKDINWWTGVVWITCGLLCCFYQLFRLSFWRHPFTAEDPMVSKWCDAKFLQIFSDEEKLIYMVGLSVSTFSANIVIFGWTIPLIFKNKTKYAKICNLVQFQIYIYIYIWPKIWNSDSLQINEIFIRILQITCNKCL